MVILRPFEKEDIENYRKWVNNAEIAYLVDRALPVTRQEHEKLRRRDSNIGFRA